MVILLCVFNGMVLHGKQTDTLRWEDCMKIAANRSSLNKQKSINADVLVNKIKNLNTNWFPGVGINAQALYNSETIDFSELMGRLPGISVPSLPLDQYKVWADFNQQLFDGGTVKAQKAIEKTGYEAGMQQTEADLLAVRQQVSKVYFSLLLTQKSAAIIEVSLNELSERKKVLQAGVNHGVVLPEHILSVDAEEIALQQKLTELRSSTDQLFKTLSILMDSTFTNEVILAEPNHGTITSSPGIRPEFMVFDKQKEQLGANQKLVSSLDLPKVFAFSQVAYGRPGFDMLNDKFHAFYSVGMGMKWNFMNYGDNKRQKKILEMQKEMIEVRRENFNDQLEIQLQTERSNIEKYEALMKQDKQILELRKTIASSSFSKLNNGIITSTDYLTDMNAEILANLQYENHKILKIQAEQNYLFLQGKL